MLFLHQTHPEDAQQSEGNELDEQPRLVVLHIEQHGVRVAWKTEYPNWRKAYVF